jgi:hypothetical protein
MTAGGLCPTCAPWHLFWRAHIACHCKAASCAPSISCRSCTCEVEDALSQKVMLGSFKLSSRLFAASYCDHRNRSFNGHSSSATTISAEDSAATLLVASLLSDSDDVDRYAIEAHALEQVLGVGIDVQLAALGVLSKVESRNFGHVLILAFTLFFL